MKKHSPFMQIFAKLPETLTNEIMDTHMRDYGCEIMDTHKFIIDNLGEN